MSEKNQYSLYLFTNKIWYMMKLNLSWSLLSLPTILWFFFMQFSLPLTLFHVVVLSILMVVNLLPVTFALTKMIKNNSEGLPLLKTMFNSLKTNYLNNLKHSTFWGVVLLLLLTYRVLFSANAMLIGILDLLLVIYTIILAIFAITMANQNKSIKHQLIDSLIISVTKGKMFLITLVMVIVSLIGTIFIPFIPFVIAVALLLFILNKLYGHYLAED